MKTILLSALLMLCTATLATAQRSIHMSDDYWVNVEDISLEPLRIKKYVTIDGKRTLADEPVSPMPKASRSIKAPHLRYR